MLVLDIETSPILAYVWGLWDNNVSLEQIHSDWYVLSFAAKWLDEDNVMYVDQSGAADIGDDYLLLQEMWLLLDKADVILTQNGKRFDEKRLNARFLIHGFQPPSSYKHIDTLQIAKKKFGFTSNKLEYMSDKLCTKYKKLKHKKYPGWQLWLACLKGDPRAWAEMKRYNVRDVLALQELWTKLRAWDNTVNFNLYSDTTDHVCVCGSKSFKKQGWHYTAVGKYQRYRCKKCGHESRDRVNMFSKTKRASLRGGG